MIDMSAFVVINLRGTVNRSSRITKTLEHLHIETRFRATIIPDNPVTKGMLQTVKNYVAWIEADPALIKLLITKRGKKTNTVSYDSQFIGKDGFKDIDELVVALNTNKVTLSSFSSIKPSFRLSPPRGGFRKSSKRMYNEGGILGYNPNLSKLISNMM